MGGFLFLQVKIQVHVKDQGCARHRANHLPKYVWKQHVYVGGTKFTHPILIPTNPITCWEWFHCNPTTMPFRCDLMPYDPTPMPACPAWTLELVNHRLPNLTWEALFLLIGYYGRLQVISICSIYLTCIIIGCKLPKLSMYGVLLTYIWLTFMVNVGKHIIRGSYGFVSPGISGIASNVLSVLGSSNFTKIQWALANPPLHPSEFLEVWAEEVDWATRCNSLPFLKIKWKPKKW